MINTKYIHDNYEIEFSPDIKHKIYDHKYCYGIIFHINDINYEIVHNRESNWNRILIYDGKGLSRDIPFKKESVHVLPDEIIVRGFDGE
jgi:hypothetical protein